MGYRHRMQPVPRSKKKQEGRHNQRTCEKGETSGGQSVLPYGHKGVMGGEDE